VSVSSLETRAAASGEQLSLWEPAGGETDLASAARADLDAVVDAIR